MPRTVTEDHILKKDLLIAALAVVVMFVLFHTFEVFESLYRLTREHESWELDEAILILLALPLPLAWLAYRRARHILHLSRQRDEMEEQLALLGKLESLGTLAGGMAHELNNQLHPVLSMGELLLSRTPADSPDHRKLELIVLSARNARSTVARILAFARSGTAEDTCLFLENCRLAEDVVRTAWPNGIALHTQIMAPDQSDTPEALLKVPMNADDLKGVVVNLLTNALQACEDTSAHSGTASVTLTVGTIVFDARTAPAGVSAGSYAMVAVHDTGVGMAPETIRRMFDPFFTTKAPGRGTGLGLSIAHTAIHRAGGTFTVRSSPGQGSDIRIYLPLLGAGAPARTAPSAE